MDTKITAQELKYATAFNKAFILPDAKVSIVDTNCTEDGLDIGEAFYITKVVGTRETLNGEIEVPNYMVEVAMTTFSNHSGYDVDISEIGTYPTLHEALATCAQTQLAWAISNAEFLIEDTPVEESY